MDVSSVASAAETLGQIMQMANEKTIDLASKMIKMDTEMALSLGKEAGKGENFDAVA